MKTLLLKVPFGTTVKYNEEMYILEGCDVGPRCAKGCLKQGTKYIWVDLFEYVEIID